MLAPDGRLPVLVVEDDPVVLRLCRTVLEREGYLVLTAVDAGDALRVASRASSLAVAVVDLILPDHSGGSLIESLRGAGMTGAIVCMSGYPFADFPGLGKLETCPHYFLPKPFTPKQLIEIVATALRETCGQC